jgi:hypothetical protein
MKRTKRALQFKELTPDRWSDVEALFGTRGACGGCWCMLWVRVDRDRFGVSESGLRRMREAVRRSTDNETQGPTNFSLSLTS